MNFPSIEDFASFIGIVGSVSTGAIWLFRKLAIDPLRVSLNALNETLEVMRKDTEKRIAKVEDRVDHLEKHDVRHEEQIKTLFENQKEEVHK